MTGARVRLVPPYSGPVPSIGPARPVPDPSRGGTCRHDWGIPPLYPSFVGPPWRANGSESCLRGVHPLPLGEVPTSSTHCTWYQERALTTCHHHLQGPNPVGKGVVGRTRWRGVPEGTPGRPHTRLTRGEEGCLTATVGAPTKRESPVKGDSIRLRLRIRGTRGSREPQSAGGSHGGHVNPRRSVVITVYTTIPLKHVNPWCSVMTTVHSTVPPNHCPPLTLGETVQNRWLEPKGQACPKVTPRSEQGK